MSPKIKKMITEKQEPELAVLEEKIESDNEIEAPIPLPPPVAPKPKPKRILSEKQKETLAKGREIAHARRMHKDIAEQKKEKKIEIVNRSKKEIEDALIKTAVLVKKKQLLEEKRLAKFTEDIDEEIPDEVIKKIIREKKKPKPVLIEEKVIELPAPPNPFAKYYFL